MCPYNAVNFGIAAYPVWNNLSWLLLQAGNLEAAIESTNTSLQIEFVDSKYARYYRGLIRARQGQFTEAEKELQYAQMLVSGHEFQESGQATAIREGLQTLEKCRSTAKKWYFFSSRKSCFIEPKFESYREMPFVILKEVIPGIKVDDRFERQYGKCLLQKKTANALAEVNRELSENKITLLIKQSYIPLFGGIQVTGIDDEVKKYPDKNHADTEEGLFSQGQSILVIPIMVNSGKTIHEDTDGLKRFETAMKKHGFERNIKFDKNQAHAYTFKEREPLLGEEKSLMPPQYFTFSPKDFGVSVNQKIILPPKIKNLPALEPSRRYYLQVRTNPA